MSVIIQVFLTLCRATISAAGLILCVVLVRGLMVKWAPRRAVMLLWLAVALRLLIPFSFESHMSLLPATDVIPAVDELFMAPAETDSVLEADTVPVDELPVPTPPVTVVPPAAEPQINLQRSPIASGAILWLVGVAALMLYAVISYIILSKRVAKGVLYTPKDPDGTPTPCRVKVKQCERVSSPFIMGIFTPCIYLPYGLDGKTEACVLSHELAHIRRGDHIIKPAAFALIALHWFNPLVWVAWVLYCRDIEVACDEQAVKDMTLEDRKTYAAALVSFLPSAGRKRTHAPLCPPAFGETDAGRRVKRILTYKKPILWTVIPLVLIAAILTVVFFMTAPEKNPNRGEWEGVITVQGSECDYEGMYLDLHTYDPDKDGKPYLKITFKNQSGETVGFGEPYKIYYLDGDTWVDTAVYGVAFTMPLYLLNAGDTVDKAYTPDHCDLSRYGTYKFVTDITYPTNQYGATEECEISLTFVLEGTGDVIGTYPEDFAVRFESRIGEHPDCLDTFDGYVQKDLVLKFPGYARASLKLTDAEKQYLWEITKQCGIIGMSGDMTIDGVDAEPNTDYTVTVRANGQTYTITGDGAAMYAGGYHHDGTPRDEWTTEHTHFYTYVTLLRRFMYDTDEWQRLPETEGGYD